METIAGIMETLMVVCFGISWPLNIVKAWKARTARGTSVLFYLLIWSGYLFAMIGKFTLIRINAPQPWYETVQWYVMLFYVLNILMVSSGILIYIRNRLLDRAAEQKEIKKQKRRECLPMTERSIEEGKVLCEAVR